MLVGLRRSVARPPGRPGTSRVKSGMRYLGLGLVALVLVVSGPVADAQSPPRLVVFFVDDMHMDFRDTPRLRTLVARLGRELDASLA